VCRCTGVQRVQVQACVCAGAGVQVSVQVRAQVRAEERAQVRVQMRV
jgi:hypothetical protein